MSKKYVYLTELPPTAEPLTKHNGYNILHTFVDKVNRKVYWFNGEVYVQLRPVEIYSIQTDTLPEPAQYHIAMKDYELFKEELQHLESLPPTAEPLTKYGTAELDSVFIDKTNEKVYQFDSRTYNECWAQVENDGYAKYVVKDKYGFMVTLQHHILFGLN